MKENFHTNRLPEEPKLVTPSQGKGIQPKHPKVIGKLLGETMHGVDPLRFGFLQMLDEFSMIGMI
jgi:hypothetical protein